MEFHPSLQPIPPPRNHGDFLWLPGSSSARNFSPSRENMDRVPVFPLSPRREPLDLVHVDRLRCKQDLQKLYEDTSESSYDLSLKDIVDPCYSISGNLKAIVAEGELNAKVPQDAGRSRSWKGSSIPKLTFSFSFPGLKGKSRHTRPNPYAAKTSPLHDGKDAEASTSQRSSSTKLSPSKYFRSSPEGGTPSKSRIHPSNQCSTCSSYTIFFKCRCLVCGRLYCSNCAREHLDSRSGGYKCKEHCKNGSLSKRLSGKLKLGSRCWPFGHGVDVRRVNGYN